MAEPSPHARIVAELRRRIASGALAPGDRLPSTRALAASSGVALATATKALSVLKQEGLIRAVPRVGTLVAGPRRVRAPSGDLSRASIVAASIAIADAEGLGALSMRAVASALGVPAMSLYRHVPGKDELLLAMIDAVFAEVPPCEGKTWRARIEAVMRGQWALYREHGWLARALSVTRPQLVPNGMRHTESVLAALDAEGLSTSDALRTHVTLMNFVRGVAMSIEAEAEAEAETGISQEDWLARHEHDFAQAFATGAYPMLARTVAVPDLDMGLDALFAFGMARLLDGVERFIADGRRRRR